MNDTKLIVRLATSADKHYAETITTEMEESAKARGTGIAKRSPAYIEQKMEEGGKIYQCMKVVLLASMNGYAPQVAIEFGRKVLYSPDRPSFKELEDEVKNRKGK